MKRLGSAYDAMRNRQLAWDEDYVNPINRRAFGFEKEEYMKVYPDAGTQQHKPELPQQLQYNFDLACDKFISQLMHFVSLIQTALAAEKEINTLKWSDLFDTYSNFRLTIQYFMKLQNYRSTNIVAAISKVVSAFLRFITAFDDYTDEYEEGFFYEQELNKTIVVKVLEMESFLEGIQQQFQVYGDSIDDTSAPTPAPAPAPATGPPER